MIKKPESLLNLEESSPAKQAHWRGSSRIFRPATMFLCLTVAALSASFGCGKRRPPVPSVERVPQRTELLSGIQRGNTVILSWPAPLANAPSNSVQSIRRIDVYRLAERPTAPLPLTETEFAAQSTLVGSVSDQAILKAGATLSYVDRLELAGQPERLRYSVRYVNAAGQRAGFSNFVLIEPAAAIAEAPTMNELVQTEKSIDLKWTPPQKNIDGSTPVNLLGYNLYRYSNGAQVVELAPLNSTLISGPSYSDKSFKFGEKYNYFVRAVSLGTNGHQSESLESNVVSASPFDIYPPAQPSKPSISPAQANEGLALFFVPSDEGDLAGYNLYRSEDPGLPFPDGWTKLNADLLTKTTYQDKRVEPGHRYYYRVTAVDTTGNVSQPSAVESEVAP